MREALHKPKRLTDLMVEKLKPPTDRQYDSIYDVTVPGLVLRVNRGGSKAWHCQFYEKKLDEDGKRMTVATTHRLKRYPILKVKEAREAARQFLADPNKALAQADSGSFREVAENYIKRHVDPKGLRTKPEIERCLDKYIYPRWGQRRFTEITRKDVSDLLDHIVDNNGPVQADAVLAIISSICNWYQSRDDAYTSPIVRRMKRTSQSERARTRVLDEAEIQAVWKAASACGVFGAMVQILLLSAQRLRKVNQMQWGDLSDGVWTIRSEPREKGNPGTLRLPKLALDIIAALPRIADNPYVFVGSRSNKPLSSFTDNKRALDTKIKEVGGQELPHWTLHDLRRSARSLLSRRELDVLPHIAEQVLGHKIPGVAGIYDRHRYDEDKADALNKLAAHIARIIHPPPANVVKLTREQKRQSRRA